MSREFIKVFFPYCIEHVFDDHYIVLNRRYKPIGFNTDGHVDFEALPCCHRISTTLKRNAHKIAWGDDAIVLEDGIIKRVYLYRDNMIVDSKGMNQYFERLENLSKLNIDKYKSFREDIKRRYPPIVN